MASSNAQSGSFSAQQKMVAGVAGIIILATLFWLFMLLRPGPSSPTMPDDVASVAAKIRAALVEPRFADLAVHPSSDLTGLVVHGDVKTTADLDELKERIEKAAGKTKIEYLVGVAKK